VRGSVDTLRPYPVALAVSLANLPKLSTNSRAVVQVPPSARNTVFPGKQCNDTQSSRESSSKGIVVKGIEQSDSTSIQIRRHGCWPVGGIDERLARGSPGVGGRGWIEPI
jgi:hypothetical protein